MPGVTMLGIFQVSVLHNLVHLLFGVAGLMMARSYSSDRSCLIGSGVVYLLLWLYGLFIGHETAANFVPVNNADDWLHFVLGAGMLALGFALSRKDAAVTATPCAEAYPAVLDRLNPARSVPAILVARSANGKVWRLRHESNVRPSP